MTEYPLIGMSPGNSYFKDDVIKKLLETVVERFGKAAVLIADIPAISTYVALGYSEYRARKEKALPKGNNLKNKVERAKIELDYSDDQVRVINWENEVEGNADYQQHYNEIKKLYKTNAGFQKAANTATREVLENADKGVEDTTTAIAIGVHYLLSELAFLEFAPNYFGVDVVTYVYHRAWPVYEMYCAGEFDGIKRPYLSHTIITVAD